MRKPRWTPPSSPIRRCAPSWVWNPETSVPHTVRSSFPAKVPGPSFWDELCCPFPNSNIWHHKHPPAPARRRQEQTIAVPGKGRGAAGGMAHPAPIPRACNAPLVLSLTPGQLQEKQICWFQSLCCLFPLSPASFPPAGSGWMQCGALSREVHFCTAAGHALPHWPNAIPECAAPQAAGAATGGAWEVFRDLFGLRFDGQMQQELGSFDHQQGPLSQSPDTGWHRAAELQEPPQPKHFPRPPLHCHRYFAWLRLGRWYKMVGLAINNFS